MKIRGYFSVFILSISAAICLLSPAQGVAAMRGLQPVDEAIIAAFKKSPEVFQTNQEQAYRVCEARLVKYYNELMIYYMELYKMETPPVDFQLVLLYLEWMKTLPTPILNDIARNSTIHHALTISILGKISIFERETGRKNSVFAPPPFVVNTTLVGPDGVAVPNQVRDKSQSSQAVKIISAETSKLTQQNAEQLKLYEAELVSLRRAQSTTNKMMMGLAVLAALGLIIGFLGFKAANS